MWYCLPFGTSGFAFQPEVNCGVLLQGVIMSSGEDALPRSCYTDFAVQVVPSFRWTPRKLTAVEFELSPVYIFAPLADHTVNMVGGRLGVRYRFGRNTSVAPEPETPEQTEPEQTAAAPEQTQIEPPQPSPQPPAVSDEVKKEKEAESLKQAQQKVDELKLSDVSVKQGKHGLTISLDDIQFKPDSSDIATSEVSKLDKVAEILKTYPNDLLVVGYCADTGDKRNDVRISTSRAGAVADYLIMKDVRTIEHITATGKGSSEAVASNDTEAGRAKNRRVEITLVEE